MIRVLGIPMSYNKVRLFVQDLLIFSAVLPLAVALRLGPESAFSYMGGHRTTYALFVLIFVACFSTADLYDLKRDYRRVNSMIYVFGACFFAMVAAVIIFYSTTSYLGRGIFLLSGALIFLCSALTRSMYTTNAGSIQWKKRILIVGAGDAGQSLLEEILGHHNCGFWVVGFVDDDPAMQGGLINRKPVLGTSERLMQLAVEHGVELIALCITARKDRQLLRNLIKCHYNHIDVQDMPTIYETITGKLPLKYITDDWLLHCAMHSQRLLYRKIKRLLDISISLLLLVLAAPVVLLAMLLIRLDSRGGVLYRQERLGQNFRKITVYKLRTMVQDAEGRTGAVWAAKDDPRVTRVGNYLRRFRVDELPQLLNVLMGDMSFVGPRPEREVFIREFEKDVPSYGHRLVVKPGLTGWAQVMSGYAGSKEESVEKLRYDLYYIKNMSIMLDMLIVLKTIRIVLAFGGR